MTELALPQEKTVAVTDDQDDSVGFPLPNFEDTPESKVVKNVKDVFKGFDPATSTGQFASDDALAVYAKNTITDIDQLRKRSDATHLLTKAAALARFWYLGQTIDHALSSGEYGSNAVSKLMVALEKSQSYIYQIRAVAVKLTLVDCYLLGMRGLETSDLRKLADVRDDKLRRQMIETFVKSIPDTSDRGKMERARQQLKAAIAADKKADAIDIGTSDPMNGGSEVVVSEEWSAAMSVIRSWNKMLKKASEGTTRDEAVAALANFYLAEDVPDAERRLEEIKEAAADTIDMLKAVKDNIDAVMVELDSLSGVELT